MPGYIFKTAIMVSVCIAGLCTPNDAFAVVRIEQGISAPRAGIARVEERRFQRGTSSGDRRKMMDDRAEGVIDRSENRFDRREGVRDRSENRFDRHENRFDRREDVRDGREDVRDGHEDKYDSREDVRDNREDTRDSLHDGGKKDIAEDRYDSREDIRDNREDGRDTREDAHDLREDRRDLNEDIRDRKEGVRDRAENRFDRHENRFDRRENIRDHEGRRPGINPVIPPEKRQALRQELLNMTPEERKLKMQQIRQDVAQRHQEQADARKSKFEEQWGNASPEQRAKFCGKVAERCPSSGQKGGNNACVVALARCSE